MEVKEIFDKKDEDIQAARAELIATIRIYKQLMQFTECLKITQLTDA